MDLNSSQDRNYFKNMIFTSLSCVHSNLEPTKQVYNSAGSDYGRIRKLEKGSCSSGKGRAVKGGAGALQAPAAVQIASLRKGFWAWEYEAFPSYMAIKSFTAIQHFSCF